MHHVYKVSFLIIHYTILFNNNAVTPTLLDISFAKLCVKKDYSIKDFYFTRWSVEHKVQYELAQ